MQRIVLCSSGGQRIEAAISASVLPVTNQSWFPFGLTGLILQSKELSRVFSSTPVLQIKILRHSAFLMVQLSHPYMTTGKTIALTVWTFVSKVMSLVFNMLSRFVITYREQASLNFMAAVNICSDFGAQENKVSLFPFFSHLFAVKWCAQMSLS